MLSDAVKMIPRKHPICHKKLPLSNTYRNRNLLAKLVHPKMTKRLFIILIQQKRSVFILWTKLSIEALTSLGPQWRKSILIIR